MKDKLYLLLFSTVLIVGVLVILSPNFVSADNNCPATTYTASECSSCCHGSPCNAPPSPGGGGMTDGTGACTCFGCTGSSTCQQECQAQGCQGAVNEDRPCNCTGCPGGGDCWSDSKNGTDQTAGDQFCRNKGCTKANIAYQNGAPYSCTCQGCTSGNMGDCAGKNQQEAQTYCTGPGKNCTGTKWTSLSQCSCTGCPTTSGGGTVTIGPPFGGGPQSINELISNITFWVLGITGAIAVLFIILAGLRYITSQGNSKQAEAAKSALMHAIIGLVIVIVSFFIVRLVLAVLAG